MENKILVAKNGFKDISTICKKFKNWYKDDEIQKCLEIIGIQQTDISSLSVNKTLNGVCLEIKVNTGRTYSVNVDVMLANGKDIVKTVSATKFIDVISKDLFFLLGGDKFNKLTKNEQTAVLEWIIQNKVLLVSSLLKGEGISSVEWVLVAQKEAENAQWRLININQVINFYSDGEITLNRNGSMRFRNAEMIIKDGVIQLKLNPITMLFI